MECKSRIYSPYRWILYILIKIPIRYTTVQQQRPWSSGRILPFHTWNKTRKRQGFDYPWAHLLLLFCMHGFDWLTTGTLGHIDFVFAILSNIFYSIQYQTTCALLRWCRARFRHADKVILRGHLFNVGLCTAWDMRKPKLRWPALLVGHRQKIRSVGEWMPCPIFHVFKPTSTFLCLSVRPHPSNEDQQCRCAIYHAMQCQAALAL